MTKHWCDRQNIGRLTHWRGVRVPTSITIVTPSPQLAKVNLWFYFVDCTCHFTSENDGALPFKTTDKLLLEMYFINFDNFVVIVSYLVRREAKLIYFYHSLLACYCKTNISNHLLFNCTNAYNWVKLTNLREFCKLITNKLIYKVKYKDSM